MPLLMIQLCNEPLIWRSTLEHDDLNQVNHDLGISRTLEKLSGCPRVLLRTSREVGTARVDRTRNIKH